MMTPFRILAAIVTLAAVQSAGAEGDLMREEEILDYGPIDEAYCEPIQTFQLVGSGEGPYFGHIVQTRYKYPSGCRAVYGSASLYKQEGVRFRRMWSKGAGDPSVGLQLSVTRIGEFMVLVFDFSDGGNGHISHQTAYIVDEDENVVPLDESAVHEWLDKHILPDQRVHASSRIDYSTDPISYRARVMRVGDHRHAAPQAHLSVEAEVTKVDSSYSLVVMDTFKVGGSNSTDSNALEHPSDIRAFVERRRICEHFRGEDAYDYERSVYLYEKMLESCKGTDNELRMLKKSYLSDDPIFELLANFEDAIEPRVWRRSTAH